ncbi:MAG: tRNA (N(6)-L-threonylcarbamoyladenosine(37)-C(2))-methylthiotransferase MtaB [Deltaproteobacteria bacterium]|nr:tRNA (N(6)-L-threonylcarbamoyladenosine(37)-C(2))-methylthiotransferase MtaB [Deltaproteobacteria bacterium]
MRVAIATLGCKVNQYDSAAIEAALRNQGCEIVEFAPGADVYVVNTCTVTDRADAESRQLARRARRFNDAARVVMTGCFAQISPQRAAIPEVDYVVGLNRLDDVVRAVRDQLQERLAVDDLRTARKVKTLGGYGASGQTRAFLKIQEGCDLFCTFCIVPFARGASRSVPPRDVVEQLEHLAARGFQEVVLTGVHLGGYGLDLTPRLDFCDLVEMLVERSIVPRLRLSSIDPPEVTQRLLQLVTQSDGLCPHFHIPIQAANDQILARMRRKYDTHFLRDLMAAIRESLPSAAIGTDVIAGFPGESQQQFADGLAMLERLPLTYFHVFPYSRRAGTTAAKLPDHLPSTVVRDRACQLRAVGERKRAAFAQEFVGKTLQVLAEAPDPDNGRVSGYSRNYQRVEIDAAGAHLDREVAVHVSAVRGARLLGRILPKSGGTEHVAHF